MVKTLTSEPAVMFKEYPYWNTQLKPSMDVGFRFAAYLIISTGLRAATPWTYKPETSTSLRATSTLSKASLGQDCLEMKFNQLADTWKSETKNLSSIREIVMHPAYQAIIAIGPQAIRLIMARLEQEPDHWFWALHFLAEDEPVTEEMRGDIAAMTKAWLKWGRDRGLRF